MEIRSKRIVTTASSEMQPEVRFGQATIDSVSITFPWIIIVIVCASQGRKGEGLFRFASILYSPFFSRSCHYTRTICLRRWTNGPLSRKFLDRGPRAGNRPSKTAPVRSRVCVTQCVSIISHKSDPITISGSSNSVKYPLIPIAKVRRIYK